MLSRAPNDLKQELTAEELREMEAAEKKEPVFDEDSPAMKREKMIHFKHVNNR